MPRSFVFGALLLSLIMLFTGAWLGAEMARAEAVHKCQEAQDGQT